MMPIVSMEGETWEERRCSEEETERENHRSATRFETYANVSLTENGAAQKRSIHFHRTPSGTG
jgi:hypothetical protein